MYIELGMSSVGSSNWSSMNGNKSWYVCGIYCCNEIYLKHSVHAVNILVTTFIGSCTWHASPGGLSNA